MDSSTSKDASEKAEGSSIDSLAYPLTTLTQFRRLLDCPRIYRLPFPTRPQVIANIVTANLQGSQRVTGTQVGNVLDKLTAYYGALRTEPLASIDQICQTASSQGTLHVAFAKPIKCTLCEGRLQWVQQPSHPFFFPPDRAPSKGLLFSKVCTACNSLFYLGYYCPKGSSVRRPYLAASERQDWFQLSGDTIISWKLLKRHDYNL
jgi:hypothetical protein